MAKLSKIQLRNRRDVLDDASRTPEERLSAHLEIRNQMMNPKEDDEFDPDTFDPMEDMPNYEIIKRARVVPPSRLPNMHGLKPKEILDGQMVGMYESKQDLYLLIATLSNRITDLETEVADIKAHLGI